MSRWPVAGTLYKVTKKATPALNGVLTKVLGHKFDIPVDARILPRVPNPSGYRRPAFVLFREYITIIFWTKRPILEKLGSFLY